MPLHWRPKPGRYRTDIPWRLIPPAPLKWRWCAPATPNQKCASEERCTPQVYAIAYMIGGCPVSPTSCSPLDASLYSCMAVFGTAIRGALPPGFRRVGRSSGSPNWQATLSGTSESEPNWKRKVGRYLSSGNAKQRGRKYWRTLLIALQALQYWV